MSKTDRGVSLVTTDDAAAAVSDASTILSDTELIDHSLIENLEEGFVIDDPHREGEYVIQEKLGNGGEGYSYLAVDKEGKAKVIKLVTTGSSTVSQLEEKLRTEFRRVNTALDTNYTSFPVNLLDIAVVGDYIEGLNLEQEVLQTERVFTQNEVVEFMMQIATNYLQPLHEDNLVHRDIKPQNIICTHVDDEDQKGEKKVSKYSLIDFGLLRENKASATITMTIKGTPGYCRIKGEYETTDDHYSLAKTAYFLLTGKHPQFVGHDKYDAMHDDEIFTALKIDDRLKEILFRMLGHEQKNRFENSEHLAGELKKLQKKLGGTEEDEVGLDISSARALTKYREASVPPIALQRKMNGLMAVFEEKYECTLPGRNPMSKEYMEELGEVLETLGYEERKIDTTSEGMTHQTTAYFRLRKASENIDVLHVSNGTEGKRYLNYFWVKDEKKGEELCKSFEKKESLYSVPKKISLYVPLVGGIVGGAVGGAIIGFEKVDQVGGIFLGGILGGICGGIASAGSCIANYDIDVETFHNYGQHKNEDNSYLWGLFLLTFPHVVGKLSYDIGNLGRKLIYNDRKSYQDINALGEALQPAEFFTYEEKT